MNALWLFPLGVLLFSWTRGPNGLWGAVVSTVLLAFCSTMLAHSPLVTTDLSAATCWLGAQYFFCRSRLSGRSVGRLVGAGVWWGMWLLVKLSLVLVPIGIGALSSFHESD